MKYRATVDLSFDCEVEAETRVDAERLINQAYLKAEIGGVAGVSDVEFFFNNITFWRGICCMCGGSIFPADLAERQYSPSTGKEWAVAHRDCVEGMGWDYHGEDGNEAE